MTLDPTAPNALALIEAKRVADERIPLLDDLLYPDDDDG